jgi:putative CocE/NonD family hydrolase
MVQYYILNSNHWENAPTWPPPGTKIARLFLESGGRANSLGGDGRLVQKQARGSEASDSFVYDPMHPVRSADVCCSTVVSLDQSPVESRQDVLVYTTDPFSKMVRIVGEVDLVLSISSTAPDTDLMAKLVDVYPDGRAYNLSDTALRLRYRDGVAAPVLMQPGRVYQVTVHGMVTAATLLPGHRLRIEIASSNFPTFERNLNTGGRNFDEYVSRPATTRVFHDAAHASYVSLHLLSN